MIKVSILYPTKPGYRFDAAYYVDVHMPMSIGCLAPALRSVSVDIGLSGSGPDQPPPFAAMCHFVCDTVEAFTAAFLPHAEKLQGDIPNYTDIEPLIQVSEIKISR